MDYAGLAQLVSRVWSRLERGDYDDVLQQLTPDCRWERLGRWRQGHAEIREALDARPAGRTVRHQVTNLVVDKEGEDFVCSYLLTAFSSAAAPEAVPPFSSVTPHLVAECLDRCTKAEGRFMVREFDATILFRSH
jgi:hypothetical protein